MQIEAILSIITITYILAFAINSKKLKRKKEQKILEHNKIWFNYREEKLPKKIP